jgi:hypothetical protein
VLGHPNSISEGILHYNSRAELPPFEDMLSLAQWKLDMISITFHIATFKIFRDIRTARYRGVRFTFLILDPNSSYIQSLIQTIALQGGEDISRQIRRAVEY